MSVQKAKRKLAEHMETGTNWRFRALLEAALDGSDVTPRDMAKAWPTQKKDYRHLSDVQNAPNKEVASRIIEQEASDRMLGERGDETYRQLSRASDVSKGEGDRTLSAGDIEEDGKVLSARTDDVCKRMLFAGVDREEVDVLFREQLEVVIAEGAQQRQIARDASNVINVDTASGDMSLAQDDGFAPPVGVGGEIRDNREGYATVSWNAERYGQGARLEEDLLDQAEIDLIERNMEFLGRNVENSINRQWLMHLVDNAGDTVDRVADSDSPNYKALNRAIGEVDEDDFEANAYVSHPAFRTALFEDEGIRFADRSGSDETVRDRAFDPLLDLQHYGASGRTYLDDGEEDTFWDDGDNVWGYEEADDVGSVVYDTDQIHLIIYKDIEVKDYEDPIRDLDGVNARARVDTDYTQERAARSVSYAE